MCGAATEHAFRPFCSKRCADLDLAGWLGGKYAIPGPPASAEDLRGSDDGDAPDGPEGER